jgi:hypothetical protein
MAQRGKALVAAQRLVQQLTILGAAAAAVPGHWAVILQAPQAATVARELHRQLQAPL